VAQLGEERQEILEVAQDLYEAFAERYDLFYEEFGKHDPVYRAFFRSLFAENRVRRVLDCACGTGHDVHLFHSLGCQVYASDISEAMLARARKNLSACGIHVTIQKADFRELSPHFDIQFDAVVCLSTTLPHLPDEIEVVRALTSMRQVLRDGGILVLSQGMCDRQANERPRFIPIVNRRDFSRIFVIDYSDCTQKVNVLDLFHSEHLQDFKISSFEYQVVLKDDYERMLTQAGYSEKRYYGTYRFDAYDKALSDRLIVVARK
jgi:ubiquinone/menaquinone biosynthesis C-methylase UbiE